MKVKYFLFRVICLFVIVHPNADCQEDKESDLFRQGNLYYQQLDYDKAIDTYQEIIDLGFHSADLYANIGNAFLKKNSIGASILNYEKSLLINRFNNQARKNNDLAKEKIVSPITHIPDFILVTGWRNFCNSLSITSWLVIHILFLIFTIFIACIRWTDRVNFFSDFFNSWKGLLLIGLLTIISLIALLATYCRKNNLYGTNYAIIMQEKSLLMNAPDERSNELNILSEGVKVKILDKIEDWYKVELEDKDQGWVIQNNLSMIHIN